MDATARLELLAAELDLTVDELRTRLWLEVGRRMREDPWSAPPAPNGNRLRDRSASMLEVEPVTQERPKVHPVGVLLLGRKPLQ